MYRDRPTACRTYPLERSVGRAAPASQLEQHYFLVRHSYCLGHLQQHQYSLSQWEREQGLVEYNVQNDLWAEMNAFFATNPWSGEGKAGPRQRLAFMVCYCVDDFRTYLLEQKLLDTFRLNRDYRRRIATDDAELLRFGYDWLRFLLAGSGPLAAKRRP